MRKLLLLVFTGVMMFAPGCGPQENMNVDAHDRGEITISVDESFQPVIEEQIAMYQETYPNTRIKAQYKTEAECLKDIFLDSTVRMAIVTRGLSPLEEKFFRDSINYVPSWNLIARDGIAVVVHKDRMDSAFTQEALKDRLTGKVRSDNIVFDGLSATSSFRFVLDSILKGEPFDTAVVKAANGTEAVLDFVAQDTAAIGLIGFSWIGNKEIASQREWLKKVKIAAVQCKICEGQPYLIPTQESITTYAYPLVRGLYYVLRENFTGLGLGFSSFLRSERGQLIFRRFYLAPVMEFNIRPVKINVK